MTDNGGWRWEATEEVEVARTPWLPNQRGNPPTPAFQMGSQCAWAHWFGDSHTNSKTLLSPLFQNFLSTHRGYVALQRLTHRECGVLFRFESFIRVNCRQLLWSGFQVVKMQTIVAGIQPLYLKLGNRLFLLSYDVPMSVLLQCWVNCCWPCWLFQSACRLIRLYMMLRGSWRTMRIY